MSWTNNPLNNTIGITRIHIHELRANLDIVNNVTCPVECHSLHTTQQVSYHPTFDITKDDTVDISKYDTNDNPRYAINDSSLYTVENSSNCPSYCPTHNATVRAPYETYSGGKSGYYSSVNSQHENGVNSSNA